MSFLRAAFKSALRPTAAAAFRAPQRSNVMRWRAPIVQRAWYSESTGLSKDAIESRVLDVLKSFEKVDPAKVSRA
jgi:NADH dehydrogenase (ubiquinone) 1 alpha/beta subcomplex 1